MQRLTLSLDDQLASAFDQLMQRNSYTSRSEAFRDMLRRELGRQTAAADPDTPCIAILGYVYDHHERQLSTRLTELQHDHHELTISTLHAHLSHDECVETAILRGPLRQLNDFAQSVIAQTGVRHGSVNFIPLEVPAPAADPPSVSHAGQEYSQKHGHPHKHVVSRKKA